MLSPMGKHDVEIVQLIVNFALVQRFAITHRLVVASPLGDILVLFHLHLTPLASATTAQFGLGILELVNPNAKYSLKERLCNFLVAKHHCKHEPVRNGELFKRNAFCIHFFHLATETRRFLRIENRPYLYYTRNF